jgi:hypothetical protein
LEPHVRMAWCEMMIISIQAATRSTPGQMRYQWVWTGECCHQTTIPDTGP